MSSKIKALWDYFKILRSNQPPFIPNDDQNRKQLESFVITDCLFYLKFVSVIINTSIGIPGMLVRQDDLENQMADQQQINQVIIDEVKRLRRKEEEQNKKITAMHNDMKAMRHCLSQLTIGNNGGNAPQTGAATAASQGVPQINHYGPFHAASVAPHSALGNPQPQMFPNPNVVSHGVGGSNSTNGNTGNQGASNNGSGGGTKSNSPQQWQTPFINYWTNGKNNVPMSSTQSQFGAAAADQNDVKMSDNFSPRIHSPPPTAFVSTQRGQASLSQRHSW